MEGSRRVLLSLALAAAALPALAQTVDDNKDDDPAQRFPLAASSTEFAFHEKGKERLNAAQRVSPLTVDNAFGEDVSLFLGGVSFNIVDISIPGNSTLPIEFRRRFVVDNRLQLNGTHFSGLGDWDLDVPYLSGIFANDWQLGGGSSARCSTTTAPPIVGGVPAYDYWQGYQLHIPGRGEQSLLHTPSAAIPPATSGGPYPWITKNMWRIACKPSAQNGLAGEAFIAVSPEGIRYHLDWAVKRAHAPLQKTWMGGGLGSSLNRQVVFLMATRMEDTHGNWVNYTWSGDKLSSISASDGRQITLSYTGTRITSVTSAAGIWTYAYNGDNLSQVTLPDGSKWSYSQTGAPHIYSPAWVDIESDFDCAEYLEHSVGAFGYTVTAPAGASATYDFTVMRHYRHNVPKICVKPTPTYQYLQIPNYTESLTLVRKVVSGPGLQTVEWNYSYGSGHAFAFEDVCLADPGSCPATKTNTVIRPDGWESHEFGILYNVNEGQMLARRTGTGPANIMRSQADTYLTAGEVVGKPFPGSVGQNPLEYGELLGTTYLRPLQRTAINQAGVTFTRQVNSWDAFARPLGVTRSSTLGYSRTDVAAYFDQYALWKLGQPASSTNSDTGLVESSTSYDPTRALPLALYAFGKLQLSLTWNADGTAASMTDGNNNVTGLSSWYRGIPRTVTYPGGVSQAAAVNAAGWITSTTDENGYTTGYAHDAMGRVSAVTYPTGDSIAWNTTTQDFVPVASAEHGIPAGHWRQTVATGTARKLTYFDGLWRPLLTHEYDTTNPTATARFQRFEYSADSTGTLTFESYPAATAGETTIGRWQAFDPLQRPRGHTQTSELGTLTTRHDYLAGFQTRTTNPRGQQTTTAFQAWDQPVTDFPASLAQPEGIYTDIARDTFGKPNALTQRNASGSLSVTRRYVYDGYQQLCKSIEPETASTVMAYDNAGNLSWSASGQALPSPTSCNTADVAAGQKVGRTYDGRNRLLTLTFPDGNGNQSWAYTPDGLPSTVTTGNEGTASTVVNSYAYNKRRMLTGEGQQQTGSPTWSIGYGYNANGHMASLVYPDGQTVNYVPNALGQPTQAGTYASGVQYHPNGAMKQFTYGNGLVHTLVQNLRQLPARSTDSGGVLDLAWAYDANGNVDSITDHTSAGRQTRVMTYDGRDRLLTVASPLYPGGATYAYDVLDNLTRVTVAGRDHRYLYDASNRLANVTDGPGGPSVIGLGYDVRGNVTNRNGQLYQFDYGNRMRTALVSQTFRYDAQGRRTRTVSGSANLYEVYGQSGQLLFQRDDNLGSQYNYIPLNGTVVAVRQYPVGGGAETLIYWHTDALGSQIAATVGTTVVQTTEHEPYGKMLNRANNNRMGYAGHVMDAATGLIYMQQRYYDPGIGAMLSVDPVTAYEQPITNFCRYCYARNNPYKFTDPDGREGIAIRHMERDIEAMNRGDMSRGEFMDRSAARAAGAVAGLAIVGATLTAPAVTTTVLANPGAVATATEVAAGAAGVTGTAGALRGNTAGTITRSSLNRVKDLVRSLSTPAAREKPIGQMKVEKLERIVEKAGGQLRNDGASGVRGSSAGTPHVQTEGLGGKTDSRHIWTEPNVKLRNE